jgi:beta-glucanase (GH16 family)
MKNLTRPMGMAAIFHDAIRIHILHSASPLNPWIRVSLKIAIVSLVLLLPAWARAAALFSDFDSHDSANWHIANWSNGSPFDVTWQTDQIGFADSIMTLTLDDDGCPGGCDGKPYASGEYRTNAFYGYGRVEGRLRAASGDGLVTSLFTYTGPSDGNPHDEIDIEILGKDTTKVQFNYYVNGVGGHETVIDLGFDAAGGFHTYAFQWSDSYIQWYVDGILKHSVSGGSLPVTPGRIMANLWAVDATASGWAGSFSYPGSPVTAKYDWIRYTALGEIPLPPMATLFPLGLLLLRQFRRP